MTRAEKLKAEKSDPSGIGELADGVYVAAPPSAPDVSALAAEAAALDTAAAPMGGGSPGDVAPAPNVYTSELLRPLLRASFDILAPKWAVTDEESVALAEAYAAVLDKYFPDGIAGRWAAELNALILTVAILGPRLKIAPKETPKEKAAPPVPASNVELAPALP